MILNKKLIIVQCGNNNRMAEPLVAMILLANCFIAIRLGAKGFHHLSEHTIITGGILYHVCR